MTDKVIPQEDTDRKQAPMYRGLLGYFPGACYQVARHSFDGDRKHNPDSTEGPTWARGKSADHDDALVRHLSEVHTDELYHRTAMAWRALAGLQEFLEAKHGYAPGASSRPASPQAELSPEEFGGYAVGEEAPRMVTNFDKPAAAVATALRRVNLPEGCELVCVDQGDRTAVFAFGGQRERFEFTEDEWYECDISGCLDHLFQVCS